MKYSRGRSFLLLCMLCLLSAALCSCDKPLTVQTNAYFAPMEYYDGGELRGVDIDIMNAVGEKLGRTVEFCNVEFSAIFENVANGGESAVGAAGITVNDARNELVDFSVPYYTSVQYALYSDVNAPAVSGGSYVLWESLAGLSLGVQKDTTGHFATDKEIFGSADNEYAYRGALYGTDTEMQTFLNVQLAADALQNGEVDCVITDELSAKYLADRRDGLACLPLYSKGENGKPDHPVQESYAICVAKGNTELLEKINSVLNELLAEDADGICEIDRMIMRHMGIS